MPYTDGRSVRAACRQQEITGPTAGMANGHVQANLVILPKAQADDFMLFAQRNPKPCPLLEVGETGSPLTRIIAERADIRSDLPKYRIYRKGELTDELTDISAHWSDDLVYFLLGCSFSFEQALLAAGLDVRHISEGKNVPMYKTNIICQDAGQFKAIPTVVSMRPFKARDAIRAIEITRDYPAVHGSPIHLGDPALIGIDNISTPDWGDPVTINDNEIPLFWACGVTPQMAAMVAKPELMITHAPGHMFVGDKQDNDFRI